MPLPMGVWQLAITFGGVNSTCSVIPGPDPESRAGTAICTSTLHTRQLPKGSRLGASQSVGTGLGPLCRRRNCSMVSPLWMG